MKPIRQVLEEHTPSLLAIPGVVGTAQGLSEGEPCIVVMVASRTPELEDIPERIEGYRVSFRATGEFRALDSESGD